MKVRKFSGTSDFLPLNPADAKEVSDITFRNAPVTVGKPTSSDAKVLYRSVKDPSLLF